MRYYVKDYADGWIECKDAREAGALSYRMGGATIRVTDRSPEEIARGCENGQQARKE
jgi:hypothetical protein